MKNEELKILPGFGRTRLPGELVRAGLVRGAEIGVDRGEHAYALLAAGVQRLYLVDRWSDGRGSEHESAHWSNLRDTLRQLSDFPFQATVLLGTSNLEAAYVPDGALDFVYVDADHRREAVAADLAAWWPKVRAGGWICGHDFLDEPPGIGVRSAVLEFCAAQGIGELFVAANESHPNWHLVKG